MRNLFRNAQRWFMELLLPRSRQWPRMRRQHLKRVWWCQCCGSTKNLSVHHKKPFHLFPELELDPQNFVTLCETINVNCHFVKGHLRNWRNWNPDIDKIAVIK